MFSQYLDYGWALCAIRPGTKAPLGTEWNTQEKALTAAQADAASGVGLLHEFSGTCAIDVDDYEEAEKWLAGHGLSLSELLRAPSALQITSGRPGRAKLLYAIATPLPTMKVAPYERSEKKFKALELRCKGGQDILPGTIHCETGRPYEWVGEPLLGVPPLPAALQALWEALAAPAAERDAAPAVPATASTDEIATLLAGRDPDCSYDEWVKVGMAVHAATDGQAFYLWDNWSRGGEKYKGSADVMSHWSSFRAAGGVGVGSLHQERVAAVDEFPLETTVDEFTGSEDDQTPAGRAWKLLQQRLVFLTSQSKFFFLPGEPRIKHLDEHANCGLKREDLNDVFLRFMPVFPSGKQQVPTRRKPLDTWREFADPQIVDNIGFHPGAGRLYTDVDGMRYLNRFIPIKVEPLKPKAHELEAWESLTNRLHDEHYRRWLMQFFAYAVRHPGVKITQAPLLYSETPGTGKSTLMNQVPALLFGWKYVNAVSNDMLSKSFNATLADSWYIVLDELKTNGGRQDRVQLANKMKPWITDPQLSIERKGLDVYQVPNRLLIGATSNFDDAVQINDDDRRWAISEMGGKAMTDADIADLYTGFLNTDRAAGVLRYLMDRVDLTGFSPTGKAPRTAGRAVMVASGLGAWETQIGEMMVAGKAPFDRDVFTPTDAQDALHGTASPSLKRLAGILKKAPFNCTSMRTEHNRFLCWRNHALWETVGPYAAVRHLETGERPDGAWSAEVPLAIRLLAGDDDGPVDPLTDLLGNVNA